ncbi:MAG: 4-alpha-glucanotransferase, partial [Methylococcaceae bacterium]|nr:4-alpha-glucanotransferase [Methylococcaceae bacterium]
MKRTNLSLLAQRRAGVLLHISSLPSANYVGDLGTEAYRFVDFLNTIGASVWQTLPINMPHADNSPYQCLSAFAGNPDFISLENLLSQGLLSKEDLSGLMTNKTHLLEKAYLAFKGQAENTELSYVYTQQAFKKFCKKQSLWLNDFALFLALRHKFHQVGWSYWPEAYKNRDVKTLKQARKELAHEIAVIQFTQFIFFTQWLALKAYAVSKKVYFFGDIPIFVAYDSADVWAQSHLFKLDANKNMEVVAGVPPDYFSATGQRWGNPHYNWDVMAADGFSWWISRMATQNALFDIVRIDHFRGLEAAWEIPASEDTAINGQWVLAPGDALLAAILKALPNICLVAEDLGIITAEVDALRHQYNLPGMKILQFAFSGQEDNPYLPHNIEANSVAYTGTHDNDTSLGWYDALDEQQRELVDAYIRLSHSEGYEPSMPTDLIDMVFESNSQLAIIPMQDLLALDSTHRMNTPGTCTGNWHWRFNWLQLSASQ